MNMAVGKGLWPFVQRQEAAFRCYQATLRRRSQSLELVGQPSSARCQWDAPSAVDATESGFHLAQPTCSRNSSSGNLSEVEYSALQPKPGSRGARWNRRLLVAAVLCSRILNTLAPAS